MFCFVILHYKIMEEVEECVRKIENLFDKTVYRIIIVENGSNNNSDIMLFQKFGNRDNIDILVNQSNVGFAKGNNIGYIYAKQKYNPSFMMILNSDVILGDSQTIRKIRELYIKDSFHIMGPDIITPAGNHQNPFRMNGLSLKGAKRKLLRKKIFLTLLRMKKKSGVLQKIDFIERKYEKIESKNYSKEQDDVVLHGSCIVVSSKFIEENDQVFHSGTFLYGEEDLLYTICKRKGYRILYSPLIQVLHKGGGSTDKPLASSTEKRLSKLQISVESNEVLIKELKASS